MAGTRTSDRENRGSRPKQSLGNHKTHTCLLKTLKIGKNKAE